MTKSQIFQKAHQYAKKCRSIYLKSLVGKPKSYAHYLGQELKRIYRWLRTQAAAKKPTCPVIVAINTAHSREVSNFMNRWAHHSCTD